MSWNHECLQNFAADPSCRLTVIYISLGKGTILTCSWCLVRSQGITQVNGIHPLGFTALLKYFTLDPSGGPSKRASERPSAAAAIPRATLLTNVEHKCFGGTVKADMFLDRERSTPWAFRTFRRVYPVVQLSIYVTSSVPEMSASRSPRGLLVQPSLGPQYAPSASSVPLSPQEGS